MNVTVGASNMVPWQAIGQRSEASGTVDASDPQRAAQAIFSAISDGVEYDDVTVGDADVAAELEKLTGPFGAGGQ